MRADFLYYLLITVVVFLGVPMESIAQQAPNASGDSSKPKVTNPVVAPRPAPKYNNYKKQPTESAIPDFAKHASTSFFPKDYKVITGRLERKYYNDNPFDIEESDNPFALPIQGRKKRKTKEQQQGSEEAVLSALFSTENQDNPAIPEWLIFVLLGILSFMTIILVVYQKSVSNILQAFFSTGFSKQVQREQQSLLTFRQISSYLLFVMSMGTFCFLIPQVLVEEITFNTLGALLLCMGGIAAIYTLKHLQLNFLAAILPFHKEILTYSFIISNTNKIIGFVLLPLLFILAYTPPEAQSSILYTCFGILGIIYIYRSLKGLACAGNIILFHKFHFFVYLCAVEIAPILILLKLLSIL